jgi:hypothetical protein
MRLAGGGGSLVNNPALNWIGGTIIVSACVLGVVGYYGQKLQWWLQDRREKDRPNSEGQTPSTGQGPTTRP